MTDSIPDNYDTLDAINYSLVKETFETAEEFSVKEIAAITQLPVPVVSKIIERMIDTGEIQKKAFNKYIINKNHSYCLCIRIENEKIECFLYDSTYSIIAENEVKKTSYSLIKLLTESIEELYLDYKLSCIAVSVHDAVKDGIIYKDDTSTSSERTFENEFNLQIYLEEKFSVPVIIEKEINLACLGAVCEKEIQFIEDEYTACLRISDSCIQCGLVYKTNVLTGFQGSAGSLNKFFYGTNSGQDILSAAVKTVNDLFNPKTIIIYKDNTDKTETEKLKPCKGQNIVFAQDYETKCLSGFVYLMKKKTAVFSW